MQRLNRGKPSPKIKSEAQFPLIARYTTRQFGDIEANLGVRIARLRAALASEFRRHAAMLRQLKKLQHRLEMIWLERRMRAKRINDARLLRRGIVSNGWKVVFKQLMRLGEVRKAGLFAGLSRLILGKRPHTIAQFQLWEAIDGETLGFIDGASVID